MKYCRESNCKSSLFAGQSQNYLLFFTLRQKCPCSKFFWFVFSRISWKNRPEKLHIRTFFTQCYLWWYCTLSSKRCQIHPQNYWILRTYFLHNWHKICNNCCRAKDHIIKTKRLFLGLLLQVLWSANVF